MHRPRLFRPTSIPMSLALVATVIVAMGVPSYGDDPTGAPLHERIDDLLEARVAGEVAATASDAEFVRRIYLDLAGRIPSRDEARRFIDQSEPDKRSQLIDELLAGEEFPQRMTDLFHVMLMERMGEHDEWQTYLRSSFQANKPWDQMAREIAHPRHDDEATRGSAFFITKRLEKYGQNPVDYPGLVRDFGRFMLGVDLQCSQCHDDLFVDDYDQVDFQGLFAVFGKTAIRRDVTFPAVQQDLLTEKTVFKSVFVGAEEMTGPRLPFAEQEIDIATFEKGDEYLQPPDRKTRFPGIPKFNPLLELSERLPEHPMFRKNIANRLWWVMMGRGLVNPLDLQHSANPPSHPEVLELIGDELAAHHYDMRWLLRELAMTRAYQRSSLIPDSLAGNQKPVAESTYQVALEKRLSNEQLVSAVVQAVGDGTTIGVCAELMPTEASDKDSVENATDAERQDPAESSEGAGRAEAQRARLLELREHFAKAFTSPPRTPEVEHNPSVKAALFLMNDAVLLGWLVPKGNNLVARLARMDEAQQVADELYLSVLSRYPSDDEVQEVQEHLAQRSEDRAVACGELVWGLLASTEFSVNH